MIKWKPERPGEYPTKEEVGYLDKICAKAKTVEEEETLLNFLSKVRKA